jgi:hypothetical protein
MHRYLQGRFRDRALTGREFELLNRTVCRLEGAAAHTKMIVNLEARVGFEPTDGGFADLSLRPLGYRAGANEYSETAFQLSVANISN